MIYTSKQNAIIKQIASLKDKKYRQKASLYIVEGIKMVNEALLYNKPVVQIVCIEEKYDSVANFSGEVIVVSHEVFNYLSDAVTPQGVLAVLQMQFLEPHQLNESCIMLDGIQDPGNLGTIIRTAVACGYKHLILVNCCDPYSPKVIRSSMSGIFFINIIKVSHEDAFEILGDIPIIIADLDGVNLFNFEPPKIHCVVIGNEANGITDVVKQKANYNITIPMSKNIESLNAGVSLAIIIYQLNKTNIV